MFSQVKIGYCGPSPPRVRIALRPVTPGLSDRVRSLGNCSDRIALEKSETVETIVEVINPLLTKTTVVRHKVRSEYTARYEEFCKGGDQVKPSSSEFWERQEKSGSGKGSSLQLKPGKRGDGGSSVAGSVFRQLPVKDPKDVQAPAGAHHHVKEEKGAGWTEQTGGADSVQQGEALEQQPRLPTRKRSTSIHGSLGLPSANASHRRNAHVEDSKVGKDGAAAKVSESSKDEKPYVASFRRFISKLPPALQPQGACSHAHALCAPQQNTRT